MGRSVGGLLLCRCGAMVAGEHVHRLDEQIVSGIWPVGVPPLANRRLTSRWNSLNSTSQIGGTPNQSDSSR